MYSENQSKTSPFAKLTEPHLILIELLNLKVESVGFVPAVPKCTTKTADC